MNKRFALIIGLVLVLILILFTSTYTVRFHEVAIITTLGKVGDNAVQTEPGLHFQLPFFAQKVSTIDKRLQLLEAPRKELSTSDGQQVVIQVFLLWKVDTESAEGPRLFKQHYDNIELANAKLIDPLNEALNDLSRYSFDQLVGGASILPEAEQAILAKLDPLRDHGVLPITVGLSQVLLPARATTAVLSRMRATRKQLTDIQRVRGTTEHERIINDANTKSDKIMTFAEQHAETIRAKGTEMAAKYLAQMSEEEDFAIFLNWLDALEGSLARYTTVIIPTDALQPFHLMDLSTPLSANGLPMGSTRLAEEKAPGDSDIVAESNNPPDKGQ